MVFPFGLGERLTVRTQLQVLQRKGAQRRSLPCVRVLKWDGLKEVATTSQKNSVSQYLNPKHVAQLERFLPPTKRAPSWLLDLRHSILMLARDERFSWFT